MFSSRCGQRHNVYSAYIVQGKKIRVDKSSYTLILNGCEGNEGEGDKKMIARLISFLYVC